MAGAVDSLPLIVVLVPFALTVGAVITEADVDPVAAWAGSFLLFGGAAQLAAIELVDADASVVVAAATAIAVNARFFVYGPGLARWFATESRLVRGLLAVPVVDQTYLLCAARFERGDLDARGRRLYYLGVAVPSSLAWVAAQGAGVLVGDGFPAAEAMALAPVLLFAALLTQTLTSTRLAAAAGLVAIVVVATGPALGPAALGSGIVAGALVGARP